MISKTNKLIVAILLLVGIMAVLLTQSMSIAASDKNGSWVQSGNHRWWYRYSDGTYPVSEWVKIEGKWYHFDSKGWMQTGWIKDNNNWYYLNKNGSMKTGWTKYKDQWYYLKTDGSMRTGWQKYKDNWYFFNKDGVMQTGHLFVQGKEFFMDSYGSCINTDEDIEFVKVDEYSFRKYYKGIRTSDFMVTLPGRTVIQNELSLEALRELNIDYTDSFLRGLDESNAKEGYERINEPHIFTYYDPEDRFPVIFGVIYRKIVFNESGVGGTEYIRIYRMDTGELFKEYKFATI